MWIVHQRLEIKIKLMSNNVIDLKLGEKREWCPHSNLQKLKDRILWLSNNSVIILEQEHFYHMTVHKPHRNKKDQRQTLTMPLHLF